MRIAVDATCWANARGYGRFAREIMRTLFDQCPSDEFICLGDDRAFEAWSPAKPNVQLVRVAQSESPTTAAAADDSRSLGDMLALTRALRRTAPDVFFSPSVYTYFPLPPGIPAVVTIHDTIAERFPHLTLPSWKARTFWNLKVRLAIAQSRLILTVSNYSARSIESVLGVPRRRLRICNEAPAQKYRRAAAEDVTAAALRAGVPHGEPWFVYVGGFNPHKRVDTILQAHAAVSREFSPAPHLLLVGTRDQDVFFGEVNRLDAMVRDAGTGPLVHWLGFVSDDELAPLLTGATASLLPSEAEGFGLPAVEAAACGAPVIATCESPLPELLEGGGVFVTPGDVSAITGAMRLLLGDVNRRDEMGRKAEEQAAKLTWDACGRAALGAIYEAAR